MVLFLQDREESFKSHFKLTITRRFPMFHDVRVFNPNGQLTHMIPSSELSRMHWRKFEKMEDEISLTHTGQMKVPGWVKRRLDLEFPDIPEGIQYY